jgi:histone deacetylase complex regulatory component SIN3
MLGTNTNAAAVEEATAQAVEATGTQPDAVTYIKNVQERTANEPELFNQFLDVLRVFREEGANANMRDIAERIVTILQTYPELVIGFNTFLPDGYEIQMNVNNPQQPYMIIEPAGDQKSAENVGKGALELDEAAVEAAVAIASAPESADTSLVEVY